MSVSTNQGPEKHGSEIGHSVDARSSGETALLGRLGSLVVKIAEGEREIDAALRLRHKVFGEAENKTEAVVGEGRDEDRFDAFCQHLIVCDEQSNEIIATYRLLDDRAAKAAGGFYSSGEFEISGLLERHPDKRFLEFGRSCVLPEFRSKRTIELLWHGSWAYVRQHGYDVMFGCASFPGTDPQTCATGLSLLRTASPPEPIWDVKAIGEIAFCELDSASELDTRSALRSIPPLIKGYMRLGAMFSSQAVIDRQFGTIDVLVILPLHRLNPRYVKYYGENADKHSL